MTEVVEREPRIAIVGAGPSGCFVAGALRRSLPEAQIMVIDRLPCPFGLVRYGVAADHQSTKNITRQFDRIFAREGVVFAGNVRITREPSVGALTLEELSTRVDAVVLATGLAADRALDVPGGDLPGVYGSGAITGLLNSHPDVAVDAEVLSSLGESIAVVGMGNVAIDLIRFLAKDDAGFDGSDINDTALSAYCSARVSTVDVFSRSPIELVKCDAQMIRELARIPGLRVTLHGDVVEDAAVLEDPTQRARVEALRELAATTGDGEPRTRVRMHFGARPERVLGEERVTGLRVTVAGDPHDVVVDSVISAIGFAPDRHSPDVAAAAPGSGRVRPGLYRVGWFRRGPSGTIPENRSDALAVAAEIVADLTSGTIVRANVAADDPMLPPELADTAVDYAQWLAIDRHERETAQPERARTKLPSAEQMLDVARRGVPAA